MVNNFKPYDPNDDSERSSAESYLPPKKTTPKIDSSSQSFPEFPEELERDNYVPPVTPNPTKNKIIEESEKIQQEKESRPFQAERGIENDLSEPRVSDEPHPLLKD